MNEKKIKLDYSRNLFSLDAPSGSCLMGHPNKRPIHGAILRPARYRGGETQRKGSLWAVLQYEPNHGGSLQGASGSRLHYLIDADDHGATGQRGTPIQGYSTVPCSLYIKQTAN